MRAPWIGLGCVALTACGVVAPSDDYARGILADLSPYERQALADKYVSFGEYEASVQRNRECVIALGFKVSPITFDKTGFLTFSWSSSTVPEDEREARQLKTDDCFHDVDAVEAVYSLHSAPSEAERKAGEAAMRACVEGLGVAGAADAPLHDVIAELYDMGFAGQVDPDAGQACLDMYVTVSAIPVPGLADLLEELTGLDE